MGICGVQRIVPMSEVIWQGGRTCSSEHGAREVETCVLFLIKKAKNVLRRVCPDAGMGRTERAARSAIEGEAVAMAATWRLAIDAARNGRVSSTASPHHERAGTRRIFTTRAAAPAHVHPARA